jgi:hypothetical protein
VEFVQIDFEDSESLRRVMLGMGKPISKAAGRTITYVDVPPEATRGALGDWATPVWQLPAQEFTVVVVMRLLESDPA